MSRGGLRTNCVVALTSFEEPVLKGLAGSMTVALCAWLKGFVAARTRSSANKTSKAETNSCKSKRTKTYLMIVRELSPVADRFFRDKRAGARKQDKDKVTPCQL